MRPGTRQCLLGGVISGLAAATAVAHDMHVVITEINYHPYGNLEQHEFVELFNRGPEAVDLSSWRLLDAVEFAFPEETFLQPGSYLVVAKDPAAITHLYGIDRVIGPFDGRLDNDGEMIRLVNAEGVLIERIHYSDNEPWSSGPDGDGPTLERKATHEAGDRPWNWSASRIIGGTPGAPNSVNMLASPPRDVVINEVASSAGGGWIELYNRSGQAIALEGYRLVSEPLGGSTYTIGGGETIPRQGYWVVSETQLPFQLEDNVETRVSLLAPDGRLIDTLNFRTRAVSGSSGRVPDGGDATFAMVSPSRGGPNHVTLDRSVVVNEIMYHPAPPAAAPGEPRPPYDRNEEFIELYNRSSQPVSLTGWRLTGAADYALPAGTQLEPGTFLVIARHPPTVKAKYGLTSGVIGGFTDILADGHERIVLRDALSNPVNEVTYADDGTWSPEADGLGPSLELVYPDMDNDAGAAWRPSAAPGGTPGAVNSVHVANPPPVIRSVRHDPPAPTSAQEVTVTARVSDADGVGEVRLWHAEDPGTDFAWVLMADDGTHGDGAADDGLFGAVLPARPANTIVRFFIEAVDGQLQAAQAPVFPPSYARSGPGDPTFLYQVDDRTWPGDLPLYRVIMTSADLRELRTRDLYNDERLDGTFVSGNTIVYNVGVRYRGQGSRTDAKKSFRIQFYDDQPWSYLEDLNLNAHHPHQQYIGQEFFSYVDLPVHRTQVVLMTLNNDRDMTQLPDPNTYVQVESVNESYLERVLGSDAGGNLYRAERAGDLSYQGPGVDDYRDLYVKRTHEDLDDYRDIIALTDLLTNTPDAQFADVVRANVDVDEWMRFFASMTVVTNDEGGIALDTGDDYFLYRRPSDQKWLVIPWDFDSVWDLSSTRSGPDQRLFRAGINDAGTVTLPIIRRILRHPDFAPIYYREIRQMMAYSFHPAIMADRLANLRRYTPRFSEDDIDEVESFVNQRRIYLASVIPPALTVSLDEAARPRVDFIIDGEEWRFFRGSVEPSAEALAWTRLDFPDQAWETGPSGFGYGDGDDRTVLTGMQNSYTSIYIRRKFLVEDLAAVPELMLDVWYDDGFVAYLNGREVQRRNVNGTAGTAVPCTGRAAGDHEAADSGWETFNLTSWLTMPESPIVQGENVLAIQGLNRSLGSSDLSLRPRLYVPGIEPPPSPRVVHINDGEQWLFFRGRVEPSAEPLGWTLPGFEAAGWEAGASGFGYGDSDDLTRLDDMQGSYLSVYIRKTFTIQDPAALRDLLLEVWYDDGFVAYLNGREITRGSVNTPAGQPVAFDDEDAAGSHEAAGFEAFDLSFLLNGPDSPLKAGENVLALHGLNVSYGSSDFSLRPRLSSSGPPGGTVTECEGGLVTTSDTLHISGTAPAGAARWVRINNQAADYQPVSWDNRPLTLSTYEAQAQLEPGPNHVEVVALDADLVEVARRTFTVIRAVDTSTPVAGTLGASTTWTQQGGPYHITANVIVPAGGQLVIEAGTDLLFDSGAALIVQGRLRAQGTAGSPVRFQPFSCGQAWPGLLFLRYEGESRLEHCHFFDATMPVYENISYTACINVVNAPVRLEHARLEGMRGRGIDAIQNASLVVLDSSFINIAGAVHVKDSYALLENLTIQGVAGALAAIEVEGGSAAQPIIRHCLLDTGGNAGISLLESSALLEGNTISRMAGPGVLLEGASHPVVRGSVIAGCATGMAVRDAALARVSHCTVVDCQIGLDLQEAHAGAGGGQAVVDSTIIWNTPVAAVRRDATSSAGVEQSDVAGGFAGSGNLAVDPYFVDATAGNYYLAPNSPCVGTGLDGTDMGALPAADNPVFHVVVNEWMAQNSLIPDPQGEYDDWIELYNAGGEAVDVSGLFMSDRSADPGQWKFPPQTSVPPGGFLVVWADRDVTDTPGLHAGFALDVAGEEIGLYLKAGGMFHVIDRVTFGPQVSDVSSGRTRDGSPEIDQLPRATPGRSNNPPPDLANGDGLLIVAPPRFLPSSDVPLRIEVLTPQNTVDRNAWTGQILLSTDPPESAITASSVEVLNGMASGQFRISAPGPVRVTATFGERHATIELTGLVTPAYRSVSGSLPSGTSTWDPADGVVRVTGDLTVPAGALLRINAGTMVLLNAGVDLNVEGSLECAGTLEAPVLITADAAAWGQILHAGSTSQASYQYTFLTHGGDSPGAGHTGAGPVIRASNGATASFTSCSLIDEFGKAVYASGCHLSFDRCLFARMVMGMEVVNTDTVLTDTFFHRMMPGGDVEDHDALYLNGSGTMTVRRCVFAYGGDEGIDTLSSAPLIEQSIIYGFEDKGISVYSGAPRIRDCLLFSNAGGAISAKGDNTDVYISNCTLFDHPISFEARDKFGEPNNVIRLHVVNTIAWASPQVVRTDYQPENIMISYSLLDPSTPWPGVGNLNTDPRFRDTAGRDFRLRDDSPGVDTGDPAFLPADTERDLDGKQRVFSARVDRGAYEFLPRVAPDFDQDGDVDVDDYARFAACLSGASVPHGPACAEPDLDGDQDVDQSDFGAFQRCYSGAGRPCDPGCMN